MCECPNMGEVFFSYIPIPKFKVVESAYCKAGSLLSLKVLEDELKEILFKFQGSKFVAVP